MQLEKEELSRVLPLQRSQIGPLITRQELIAFGASLTGVSTMKSADEAFQRALLLMGDTHIEYDQICVAVGAHSVLLGDMHRE